MDVSASTAKMPSWLTTPPRLRFADGSIEGLKWIALLLMTGDHINKYLFNSTLPYLFEAGRLAMPIFVFVLAHNLARPGVDKQKAYARTMIRLGLFGLLAMPAFITLGSLWVGWFPLNIMFTLLVMTAVVALTDKACKGSYVAGLSAALVFLWGGGLVEFWWPAIVFGLACWWYCKKTNWVAVFIALAACYSMTWINGNHWAFAAIFVVVCAAHINLRLPRLRWVFYAYYPAHLTILLLIRIPMSQAGYLFF